MAPLKITSKLSQEQKFSASGGALLLTDFDVDLRKALKAVAPET